MCQCDFLPESCHDVVLAPFRPEEKRHFFPKCRISENLNIRVLLTHWSKLYPTRTWWPAVLGLLQKWLQRWRGRAWNGIFSEQSSGKTPLNPRKSPDVCKMVKEMRSLFVVYRSKIQVLRTGCYSPFSLPSSVHLSVVACDSHRIFPLDEIVVKLEWVKSIKDENFKISPAHKLKLPPAISEYIPDIILSLFDNKTCRILSLSPPSPQ